MDAIGYNDDCYEIYYMKESGLKLLLAGLGQEGWYGLFSVKVNKDTANETLAGLYQDGVIDWDDSGDAIKVRQPFAGMLDAMLEKKVCVTAQMPWEDAFVRCFYLSASASVLTQKSRREEKTLGMAKLSLPRWMRLLEDDCGRMETGESCILTCQSSKNGRVYRRIQVKRSGLRSFFLEWEGDEAGKLSCMLEELAGALTAALGLDWLYLD